MWICMAPSSLAGIYFSEGSVINEGPEEREFLPRERLICISSVQPTMGYHNPLSLWSGVLEQNGGFSNWYRGGDGPKNPSSTGIETEWCWRGSFSKKSFFFGKGDTLRNDIWWKDILLKFAWPQLLQEMDVKSFM